MNEAKHLAHTVFNSYGFPILTLLIVALLILETRNSLRKQLHNRWQRVFTNVSTALPALGVLRLFFIPMMVWLAMQNSKLHFGLNYLYKLPGWIENTIAFGTACTIRSQFTRSIAMYRLAKLLTKI